MTGRKQRGSILRLLLIAMSMIFIALVAVETAYMAFYRETIAENINLLNESQANKIYTDLNEMWYRMNLLSATLSRCDAMQAYLYSEEDTDAAMQLLRFVAYLTQMVENNIDSIIVTDLNQQHLFVYGARDRQVVTSIKAAVEAGLRVNSPTHLRLDAQDDGLSLCCVNRTEVRDDGVALYTIIAYNIDKIGATFEEITAEQQSMSLVLLDSDGRPVLESLMAQGESREEILAAVGAGGIPEGVRFYQTRSFPTLRWQLIAFVQDQALEERVRTLKFFAYTVTAAVLVLLVISFKLLNDRINEPIRQIIGFMRRQAEQPDEETLQISNQNELEQIARGLNEMLRTQRAMAEENLRNRERVFETELAQKESEIQALAHQVNPHFLYNTLDCMRGMAMARGMDDLEQMIFSLACVFRYVIRAGDFVQLREEIQSIRSYMDIIRIRHNGRIDVRYELEEDALDCLIPKMILQPVVENAILYGMEPVKRKGFIEIRAWADGDALYLQVRDEGKGMEPQALEQLLRDLESAGAHATEIRDSIGLRNIQRRLRLLYDESCGLTVSSEPGKGTRVTLRMHRRTARQDEKCMEERHV